MNIIKWLYDYLNITDKPYSGRSLALSDKPAELQYDDLRNPILVVANNLDMGVLSLYGYPRRLVYFTWNILLSKHLNVSTELTGAYRDIVTIELDDGYYKIRIHYLTGVKTKTTFECIDMCTNTVIDSEIDTNTHMISLPN